MISYHLVMQIDHTHKKTKVNTRNTLGDYQFFQYNLLVNEVKIHSSLIYGSYWISINANYYLLRRYIYEVKIKIISKSKHTYPLQTIVVFLDREVVFDSVDRFVLRYYLAFYGPSTWTLLVKSERMAKYD